MGAGIIKTILLLFVVFCSLMVYTSGKVEISVDWKTGRNDESCLLAANGPNVSLPCRTLDYAFKNITNGSKVVLYSGTQVIEKDIEVSGITGIEVMGQIDTVVNCTKFGIGITFSHVRGLVICSIVLEKCGRLQNSTSVSHLDPNSTALFRSAVYLLNSTNITITHTTFSNNYGTGLTFYDTSGEIKILNCQFLRNSVPKIESKVLPGGGGLYIELTECSPGLVSEYDHCNSKGNPYVTGNHYTIENCTFAENTASTLPNSPVTYLKRNGPILERFGFGGGLFIAVKGFASQNAFVIKNCNFSNNSAVVGGAMCIEVDGHSSENLFRIKGKMEDNTAKEGGGAVEVGVFSVHALDNNSFQFQSTHFVGNKAKYGGGATYFSVRSPYSLFLHNQITFENCKWVHNTALVGAAVALFPEDWTILSSGYLPIPKFQDCRFKENYLSVVNDSVVYNTVSQENLGEGILFSDTMSINISGNTSFSNNIGSCIHISAAQLNVLSDAIVQFKGNVARKGGGLALLGYSNLLAFPNSQLLFESNHALDFGGAIYYESVNVLDYINSRQCFLRYSEVIPMEEWKTNFTFMNNTARSYGHSIYATSLEPCARSSVTNASTPFNASTVFHWKAFSFTPSLDTRSHIITTEPAQIALQSNALQTTPGETYSLPLFIFDDLHQEIDSVLLARCLNCTANRKSNLNTYVTSKKIILSGDEDTYVSVSLNTSGNRPIGINFVIYLAECPPGYYLTESGQCDCISSTSRQLPGIVACNETLNRGYLSVGYWAGCINGSYGPLVTAECPLGYCQFSGEKNGLFVLPSNCSALQEEICGKINRKGLICGECFDNYSVFYHSNRYMCAKCSYPEYGIIFYIMSELLPLTLLFILVIIFDVNLTSGSMNSFIFFAQTLDFFEVSAYGSYSLPHSIQILSHIYWFCFGFLNLDFFRIDAFAFCLWDKATVLDVLAFKYVTTLYGLVLVCSLFCMMKFCQFDFLKRCRISNNEGYTVTNGLTAFLIISYSQCAKVSFQILTHIKLYSTSENVNVVFLSGNTPFFGSEHLKYAIPALLMTVYTLGLPLVLIFQPLYHSCRKLLLSRKILQESLNTSDSRPSKKCCFPTLNLYSKPILDALQGCYRDNARFFAGLMFLYRLMISAAFAFTTSAVSTYTVLELIVGFILTIHSLFQPYQKKMYNIVDTLIFANLGLINGITLYNSVSTQFTVRDNLNVLATVQLALVYIPFLYFLSLVTLKVASFCKMCRAKFKPILFNPTEIRNLLNKDSNVDSSDTFDRDHLPARMFEEESRYNRERELPSPIGVINQEHGHLNSRPSLRKKKSYGSIRETV